MPSLGIEGYASLFGVDGMAGNVVRVRAFAQSLSRGTGVGMPLSHVGGRTAGRRTPIREHGRGRRSCGDAFPGETAAGRTALQMIGHGRWMVCRSASWRGRFRW